MCLLDASASADARLAVARAALLEAADALAGIDPSELSEGSLGETVSDIRRAGRQLEGSAAAIAERFAHSSEWAADGARDAAAWLRGRSSEGFGAVRELMSTSSDMSVFPTMGVALRRGEIDGRHVRILGDVARQFPRLRCPLQEAEPHIVDLARVCEPARFRRELIAMCHRLDPEGAREDSLDREREFYFRASTLLDGHVRVDGMLPAEVGALLVAALESARRQVADEEPAPSPAPPGAHATSVAPGAPGAPTPPAEPEFDLFGRPLPQRDPIDVRALGQRNIEALQRILVIATAGDGGLPAVTGQRPQVNVTVSVETLSALPGEAVDCGWLERFGVPMQPIAADTARRLACDASLRPLIVDARGQLVAFGTSTRVAPPALRALVLRRDRHCRFAGCRARIDEVHHLVFFSHGGPTTSANMLGLCWHHHHLVHEGGWTLAGDANSDIKGTGPDGRVWTTGPPGG